MTLDQFRYFTAAATYQHVGRAAMAISISPSVISATIASLEDEFQCELFRKSGRRIVLTTEGKRLSDRFNSILKDIDGLKTEMSGKPEVLTGRFLLGASHFLTSRLLITGWNRLHRNHPDLVADIYSMNTAHAIAEVLSGRIDLAVCFSPLAHPDLLEYQIAKGEMLIAVKKGHAILKKSAKEQIRFLSEKKR